MFGCPHMFEHPAVCLGDVWMPPVHTQYIESMLYHICVDAPPVCLDAPYVWMLPYVWMPLMFGHPIMFGCPHMF